MLSGSVNVLAWETQETHTRRRADWQWHGSLSVSRFGGLAGVISALCSFGRGDGDGREMPRLGRVLSFAIPAGLLTVLGHARRTGSLMILLSLVWR